MTKENQENIPYSICPLNMYFEGDEDKCNQNACDFDLDFRSCSEACKIYKPNIIGIDPGLSGGIVSISDGNIEPHEMFTINITKTKKQYDPGAICTLLNRLANPNSIIFIEKMQSLPRGFKIQATFGLGWCEGFFIGLCTAKGYRYELIKPQTWQKHFGISKNKGDKKQQGYLIAQQLYPDVQLKTSRGRLMDGISDALLIATYGKRKLSG